MNLTARDMDSYAIWIIYVNQVTATVNWMQQRIFGWKWIDVIREEHGKVHYKLA